MKACNSILLVDDDEINNAINVSLINRLGLSEDIHICKNGLEACLYLRMVDTKQLPFPELIILDLDMQVMNGYEFLRE